MNKYLSLIHRIFFLLIMSCGASSFAMKKTASDAKAAAKTDDSEVAVGYKVRSKQAIKKKLNDFNLSNAEKEELELLAKAFSNTRLLRDRLRTKNSEKASNEALLLSFATAMHSDATTRFSIFLNERAIDANILYNPKVRTYALPILKTKIGPKAFQVLEIFDSISVPITKCQQILDEYQHTSRPKEAAELVDAICAGDISEVNKRAKKIGQQGINHCNNNWCPPLFYAVILDFPQIVECLLKNKAQVNLKFAPNGAIAMLLVQNQSGEVSKLLTAYGSDINAFDSQGETALFSAVKTAHECGVDIANAILARNDINLAAVVKGQTILDYVHSLKNALKDKPTQDKATVEARYLCIIDALRIAQERLKKRAKVEQELAALKKQTEMKSGAAADNSKANLVQSAATGQTATRSATAAAADQKAGNEHSYKVKLENFKLSEAEKKELELRASAVSNLLLLKKTLNSIDAQALSNKALLLEVTSNIYKEALSRFILFFNERGITASILFTPKRRKYALPILKTKIGPKAFEEIDTYSVSGSLISSVQEALDGYYRETPSAIILLIDAICAGDLSEVESRLKVVGEQGINHSDDYCYPPLFYAVILDFPQIVECLLKNGAKANRKFAQDGLIPMLLTMDPSGDVNDLLAAYGSDINAIDSKGETALFTAVFNARNCGTKVSEAILARNDLKLDALVKGLTIRDHVAIMLGSMDKVALEITPKDNEAKAKSEKIYKIYNGLTELINKAHERFAKRRAQVEQTLTELKKQKELKSKSAAAHDSKAGSAGATGASPESASQTAAAPDAKVSQEKAYKKILEDFALSDQEKAELDLRAKAFEAAVDLEQKIMNNTALKDHQKALMLDVASLIRKCSGFSFLSFFNVRDIRVSTLFAAEKRSDSIRILRKKINAFAFDVLCGMHMTEADIPEMQNVVDSFRESILRNLIDAILAGDMPRFEVLLKSVGEEINSATSDYCPPLFYAVIMDYPHMVELLLKKGSNPNVKMSDGLTALLLVCNPNGKTMQLLEKYGANINKGNSAGTPLRTAIDGVKDEELNVIKALLERNDLNLADVQAAFQHVGTLVGSRDSFSESQRKMYATMYAFLCEAQTRLEKRAKIEKDLAELNKQKEMQSKAVTGATPMAAAAKATQTPAAKSMALTPIPFASAPKKWLVRLFAPSANFIADVDAAAKRIMIRKFNSKRIFANKEKNAVLAYAYNNILDAEMVRFLLHFTNLGIRAEDLLVPGNLQQLQKKGFGNDAKAIFKVLETSQGKQIYQELLSSYSENRVLANIIEMINDGDAASLEKALRENATNINDWDYFGYAPLHYAVILDKLECVMVLLKYNAKPSESSFRGILPIFLVEDQESAIAQIVKKRAQDFDEILDAKPLALITAIKNPCDITLHILTELFKLGVKVTKAHIECAQKMVDKASSLAEKVLPETIWTCVKAQNLKDRMQRRVARQYQLAMPLLTMPLLELPKPAAQNQSAAAPAPASQEQQIASKIEALAKEKEKTEAVNLLKKEMEDEQSEVSTPAAKRKAAKAESLRKNQERLKKERDAERERAQKEDERLAQERAAKEEADKKKADAEQAARKEIDKNNAAQESDSAQTAQVHVPSKEISQSAAQVKQKSKNQMKAEAIAAEKAQKKQQKELKPADVPVNNGTPKKSKTFKKADQPQAPKITKAEAKKIADKKAQEEAAALEARLIAIKRAKEAEAKKLEAERLQRENEAKAKEAADKEAADKAELQKQLELKRAEDLKAQEAEKKRIEDERVQREAEAKAKEAAAIAAAQAAPVQNPVEMHAALSTQTVTVKPVAVHAERTLQTPMPLTAASTNVAFPSASMGSAIGIQRIRQKHAFATPPVAPMVRIDEKTEHESGTLQQSQADKDAAEIRAKILAQDQAIIRANFAANKQANEASRKAKEAEASRAAQAKIQLALQLQRDQESLKQSISLQGTAKDFYGQHVKDFNIKQREICDRMLKVWEDCGGTAANQFNNMPSKVLDRYQARYHNPLEFENRYNFQRLNTAIASEDDYKTWLQMHQENSKVIRCETCCRFDQATTNHVEKLCLEELCI